ncbi:MAG: 6-hydroxymethylpterin diphosphokinase MptE-like protein [Opitutales bacterium]
MSAKVLQHKIADALAAGPRFLRRRAAAMGCPLTANDRALAALNQKHAGKTGVVIGMGPSLQMSDLEKLKGCVTFGCNKIFLAFEETTFRPDYYSVNDVVTATNVRDRVGQHDFGGALPIHSRIVRPKLRQPGALYFDYCGSIQRRLTREPSLSRNLAAGVLGGGATVAMSMIQMAYAMGCTTVYLIGVDFSYDLPDAKPVETSVSGDVVANESQRNHFHQGYYAKGERWTLPDPEKMRRAYAYCRAAYERDGRSLINASRTTKLDALPRANFDDVFPVAP